MQSASVNYIQAASGAGGTWADPQLRADWFEDGYSNLPTAIGATLIVHDDFGRDLNSSLGHNKAGRSWANTGGSASEFYTRAGFAYHQHTAVSSLHTSLIELGDTDFDVTAIITIPVMPTGAAISARLHGRAQDSSNYYEAVFQVTAAGVAQLSLNRRVGGTGATLTGATLGTVGTGFAAGDRWAVRFRGVGSTFRGRAWAYDRQDEPATWFHDNITDTNLTTGTQVGMQSRLESGNTNTLPVEIGWQDFRAISPGIDDLSGQLGSWTVTHHLDDGLPDSVTFISGVGVPELNAELTAPAPYLTTGIPQQVAEFFSPYNEDSPMYNLPRDVAPVTLDHGVITSEGPERIRVFTGQMLDIPVRRGQAALAAASATRMAMSKLVQPPAFSWIGAGLNGTWPVSWALYQCGLYVAPPPRDGCRWYVPMHGSSRPFIPSTNVVVADPTFWQARIHRPTDTFVASNSWRPEWITGPYMLGPNCQVDATEQRSTAQGNIEFGDGDDALSQAGNKGRLEFWVRCDPTDVNNAPLGSATVSRLAGLRFMEDLVSSRGVFMGINTSRQVFVYANDGAGHSSTLTSTDTMPTDGVWRMVGAAYDFTAQKLWVRNFDGSTTSATVASFVTSSLPTVETLEDGFPTWINYVPVSEVQFATGAQANVDSFPDWETGSGFIPTAVVTKSNLELVCLAEREPAEAWEFVASFAQAELAAMRADENDIFEYLGPGWWVREDQQQVVDVYSTEINAGTPDVNIDPTKIRNAVRVSFNRLEVGGSDGSVFELNEQVTILPGITDVEFTFPNPVVGLSGLNIELADDTSAPTFESFTPYVTLNTSEDGSGSFATSAMVTVETVSWHAGAVVWRFTNVTGNTFFTANTANVPTLQIVGVAVKSATAFVTDSNDLSITQRGERSLPTSATSAVQTTYDARRLAGMLKMALRRPIPIVEGLTLFGEARRQPGDLVTVDDPSITKISGQWRVQSITHQYTAGEREVSYIQPVIIRPTKSIGVWGQSTWGNCLWGESSE